MRDTDTLIEGLETVTDDALRIVIDYDRTGFEFVYCRDDLPREEMKETFATFHDRAIMRQLWINNEPNIARGTAPPDDSSTIGLSGISYWLEPALILQLPTRQYGGTIVSLASDADAPVGALHDVCQDWMAGE